LLDAVAGSLGARAGVGRKSGHIDHFFCQPATVGSLVAAATERLTRAGCETPRLDAELLLARALDHDSRARLVIDATEIVADKEQLLQFERLLGRRERREPVAYILGRKAFRGLSLAVDRRVLIPRPETELLVEVALELPRGVSVADVGTGSGAVALALKAERPDLRVTGLDVSPGALAVARLNRDRLGLSELELACADLLDADRYEAVLANLPYVHPDERLAPEIAIFEPAEAVYGAGEDGLGTIQRLLTKLAGSSVVNFVALEVGQSQAGTVSRLVRGAGFEVLETYRDLAGHERVVVGRR
jgi:release factor glutamine methyltransferase